MRAQGVAFDLEGTIVDLEPLHELAWNSVASQYGAKDFRMVPDFLGWGDPAIAEHIFNTTGISPETLLARKRLIFDQHLHKDLLKPREGFLDVLETLQQRKVQTAIGSLTGAEQALFIIERSSLLPYFPRKKCVLREDVHKVKPAPDVYLKTANILGVRPEEQVVFEDSPTGVKASIAAGSKVIAVPVYSEATSPLNVAGASFIYEDWHTVLADLERILAP